MTSNQNSDSINR